MTTSHRLIRLMACLSSLVLFIACGSTEESDNGSVVVIPGSTLGQAGTAAADCSSELSCMSTPAGRVCVQTCQDASECEQTDARCTPITSVENLGWCDTSEPPEDETPVDEPPVDEPPVEEPPVEESDIRAAYPEGPFGIMVGEVMENHTLLDWQGDPITMGDIRADEAVSTLIIFNTVTYCRGCALKTAQLTEIHNELGGQGVLPVVALYENNDRGTPSGRDAYRYQESLELDFLVTSDHEAVFQQYFAERAHPMIIVLDAETMTILYKKASWNRAEVDAILSEHLQED